MSDEEGAFVAPYVLVLPEDAMQRRYPLREVFNGVRYIVKTGVYWRMLPHDLPPWPVVYQPMRRWMAAGSFETIVADLRVRLRRAADRAAQPSAVMLDRRTIPSTPESGARAGYDGHKRRKGSKVHAAVDTLGHLLALVVTPAHEQDRAHVGELVAALQEVTGASVELAFQELHQAPEHRVRATVIGSGAIAVARTTAARCCRSGSWRRSGRRQG